MKKIYFGLIIALVLCSCAKTELTGVEADEMIIGASMEVYPSISKAALSDTDGSFTWQTGDAIEVATSDGHAKFTLKTGAETASATFVANYSGTLGSYATYPADIFDSESIIKIPASREWSEGNTNCSMFGSVDGDNVAFKHLGGVVKVTLNGVPADAKKFVFSTPGKKITGKFDIQTETEENGNKYIATSDDSNDANSSYTLNFTLTEAQNMAFYIPLPCGTYPKFAFKLLGDDDTANPLYEFEGISAQTVNRKDILLMPAATISEIPGGGDGDFLKSVPSGTNGDYTLPDAESVILYFEGKQTLGTDDVINLKYNGSSQLPKKLCLKVKNGNKVNVSGDLPDTHVEFDQGEIVTARLRTSATTFKIVAPAKISEKLVVKGGNVEISGLIEGADNVKAIEVDAKATADGTSAPVQITIAENATIGTSGTGGENGGITTSANVVIVNNTNEPVNVAVPDSVQSNVQVASAGGEGTGTVKKNGAEVTTKPAAAIGTQNFFTLSDALNAIPQGNDQTVTINILEDIVLKASEALTINKNNVILDGQSHTITLDETDTNLDKYKEDGDNKKYGSFQMIKVTGNDVVLRNLTLDSKGYRGVSLATTWGGKNATYQNIVYNGKGSGHYYGYAASEGTLTFIGCTFNTCGYAIHTAESTTDLVVTNCNIDGWVSYGDKTKSATFTNCKFYKADDKHNGTLATVRPYCSTMFTGCSFSSDYLTDSQFTGITVRSNVVVSLKNCIVDGSENLYDLANITNPDDPWVAGGVLAIAAEGDATTGFTAGTFVAKQASDIKVDDSFVVKPIEGKQNVFTISAKPPVAKIGDVEYKSLQAAFDAVPDGVETIVTLNYDATAATLGDKNNIGAKTVILNLNGHSITGHMRGISTLTSSSSLDGATLVNYANLTINGEGTIGDLEGDYHHNALVNMSDGTDLTINGGTFVAKSCCVYHYSASSEANTASININGGTFKEDLDGPTNKYVFGIGGKSGQTLTFNYKEATSEGAKGIYCSLAGTTINIHSGSITADINAINLSMGKNVTINIDGGILKTLDSENHENNYKSTGSYTGSSLPIYASAFGSENIACNISGGEFIYPYNSWQLSGTIPATWERVINAGKGITSNVANANITASLTGGTYSTNQMLSDITNDQSEASGIVAAGYTCQDNGNGTWTVVETN